MKSNILKISFINHLKSLWGFIFLTAIILIGFKFISNIKNIPYSSFFTPLPMIIFHIVFYGWLVFPAVILHINYYLKNRNKEYEILEDRMIVRDKQGNEKVYMKSDISKIIKCSGGSIFSSYGNYNFIRLDMKNGEHIYLTSLLYPKGTIELKKIYFPDIPSYTVGRWICVTYGY